MQTKHHTDITLLANWVHTLGSIEFHFATATRAPDSGVISLLSGGGLDIWPFHPKSNPKYGACLSYMYMKFGDCVCKGTRGILWGRADKQAHNSICSVLRRADNKKPSCHWQTAWRLCTPRLCCQELPSGEWQWARFCSWQHIGPIFQLLPTTLPFDALNEGDPLKLLGSYLVREY